MAQFGILLSIARVKSPDAVGLYALALAITSPAFLFASLKLRQVQVTDALGVNTFGDFLSQRLFTTTITATLILSASALVGINEDQYLVLLAVTAVKYFDAIIDIQYGAMQRRERMDKVARAQIARGVLGLVVFANVLFATDNLPLATVALALVSLLQCANNFVRLHRLGVAVAPKSHIRVLARLTVTALPLGVSISLGSLTTNVPRYLLGGLGPELVGIFAALAYVFVAGSLIISSTAEAASPRMANLYAAGELSDFKRILGRIVLGASALGITIFVLCVAAGRPFLAFAYGEEYAAESATFVLLAMGTIPQYGAVFIGTALNAMRRFTVQLPISMAGLAVVTASGFGLVPSLGMEGAALALLIGQSVTALLYCAVFFYILRPLLRG